ncbi:MAG: pentapeptide repeat-containing protein [Pseudanabaena sp. ELA607]
MDSTKIMFPIMQFIRRLRSAAIISLWGIGWGLVLNLLNFGWFNAPAWANNPVEVMQAINSRTCVGCDLSGANLVVKKLDRSQFLGIDLRQANLQGTSLRFSNLNRGQFNQANLSGANLSYSLLRLADLRGANLSYADLTDADLSAAITDDKTNFDHAKLCHTTMSDSQIINRDCP